MPRIAAERFAKEVKTIYGIRPPIGDPVVGYICPSTGQSSVSIFPKNRSLEAERAFNRGYSSG